MTAPTVSAPSTLPARPATSPPTPQEAGATLVVAFATDPVMRWLWPEADDYLAGFRALAELMGRTACDAGTADRSANDAGVALWIPPDTELPDEAVADLVEQILAPERRERLFALLTALAELHPTDVHWYLPLIGVDPSHQGHGHGSALLRQGARRCDRDGLPAYLEASSPRNRALYERHGFRVLGEVRVLDSPPLWPMLRAPA
ncbi:GNAT family N-acetyltransferase [Egicoccus sp. AB-alg2]|uniref:GNAT family N-acetyltransferase n=1 Tax=Egicoccus sp. AB-alg2 TaxID=3242693 RepID=UPI00359DD986